MGSVMSFFLIKRNSAEVPKNQLISMKSIKRTIKRETSSVVVLLIIERIFNVTLPKMAKKMMSTKKNHQNRENTIFKADAYFFTAVMRSVLNLRGEKNERDCPQ